MQGDVLLSWIRSAFVRLLTVLITFQLFDKLPSPPMVLHVLHKLGKVLTLMETIEIVENLMAFLVERENGKIHVTLDCLAKKIRAMIYPITD